MEFEYKFEYEFEFDFDFGGCFASGVGSKGVGSKVGLGVTSETAFGPDGLDASDRAGSFLDLARREVVVKARVRVRRLAVRNRRDGR